MNPSGVRKQGSVMSHGLYGDTDIEQKNIFSRQVYAMTRPLSLTLGVGIIISSSGSIGVVSLW